MPSLSKASRRRPSSAQLAERFSDLFEHSRGGETRRRIAHALVAQPRNANRLAAALALDYKTVRYHLDVLLERGAVTRSGDGYGAVYVPTSPARRFLADADVGTD